MDQPIEDGVGDGGVTQVIGPPLARQLAGDCRRAGAIAIVGHFTQIVAVPALHDREAPVVEHEDLDAGEAGQQGRARAVRVGQRQLLKEARGVWHQAEPTAAVKCCENSPNMMADGVDELCLLSGGAAGLRLCHGAATGRGRLSR